MSKLTDKEKQILDHTIQKHSPWINQSITRLRHAGKIPASFQDDELYEPGYNAIAEALESYNPKLGSFKNHAHGIIQNRIQGHIEKEMARGQGGVDTYFLNQQRKIARQKEQEIKNAVPQIKEERKLPALPDQSNLPQTKTEKPE
jgi:hypothetical protein